MGCCSSQPCATEGHIGFQKGACFTHNVQSGLLQVNVSTAGWMSTVPLESLTALHSDSTSLTAALFDWHGSREAAEYCAQGVMEVFCRCLSKSDSVPDSLQQAFQQLDEAFLAEDSIPDLVKAVASASVAIVHIDYKLEKMVFGRLGSCNAAIGQLVHGLAAQMTQGNFIFQPSQIWNTKPLEQLDDLSSGLGIGDGRFKRKHLADLYNKCSKQSQPWTGQGQLGHVQTTEQHVTVIHEHVILGSAGFWDLLSVDDAVLRSHFFVKATSLAALDVSCNPDGGDCQANVAAHLTQYARGKYSKRQAVKKRGTDACALVMTLRWPATSGNQAFPDQSGLVMGTVKRQALLDAQTPWGRARLLWREVRMLLIEFNRARRRALRQKWLDLVIAALAAGKAQARQVEQMYWTRHHAVVRVTPSGVITNAQGKRLLPTSIAIAATA